MAWSSKKWIMLAADVAGPKCSKDDTSCCLCPQQNSSTCSIFLLCNNIMARALGWNFCFIVDQKCVYESHLLLRSENRKRVHVCAHLQHCLAVILSFSPLSCVENLIDASMSAMSTHIVWTLHRFRYSDLLQKLQNQWNSSGLILFQGTFQRNAKIDATHTHEHSNWGVCCSGKASGSGSKIDVD